MSCKSFFNVRNGITIEAALLVIVFAIPPATPGFTVIAEVGPDCCSGAGVAGGSGPPDCIGIPCGASGFFSEAP